MKIDNLYKQIAFKLEGAIEVENYDVIENIVLGNEFSKVTNIEFLNFCRKSSLFRSAIFLSNFCSENNINKSYNEIINLCYQSILKRAFNDEISLLDTNENILTITVNSILGETNKDIDFIEKIDFRTQIAIELSLDFHCFELTRNIIRALLKSGITSAEALTIIRCIIDRHDNIEKINNLHHIVETLEDLINFIDPDIDDDLKNILSLSFASFARSAGLFDRAIHYSKKLQSNGYSLPALLSEAKTYCKINDFENANTVFDNYLKTYLENDGDFSFEKRLQATKIVDEKDFNYEGAITAIKRLTEILSMDKIDSFIMSGTLLGFVRDKNLLLHDKDVDIGIFGWQDQYTFVDRLNRTNEFTIHWDYVSGESAHTIPVGHKPTKTVMDIFLFRKDEEKFYHGIDHSWGFLQRFAHTKFEIAQADFFGSQVGIPSDPVAWLSEHYGKTWNIPDKYFNPCLECPTIIGAGDALHMMLTRIMMIKSIHKKDKMRFIRAFDVINRFNESAFKIDPALNELIQERLNQQASILDKNLEFFLN